MALRIGAEYPPRRGGGARATTHQATCITRNYSDEIDAPTDVITGPVPVISINRARGYAKRVLAKRCALRIGMAGTSQDKPGHDDSM
jgi:hypothetical protein